MTEGITVLKQDVVKLFTQSVRAEDWRTTCSTSFFMSNDYTTDMNHLLRLLKLQIWVNQ